MARRVLARSGMRSETISAGSKQASLWLQPPSWARYVVCVVTDNAHSSVTQAFSSRELALGFAEGVATYLGNDARHGALNPQGCVSAWVMIGACQKPRGGYTEPARRVQWFKTIDPGGEVVKDHAIEPGYFGAAKRAA